MKLSVIATFLLAWAPFGSGAEEPSELAHLDQLYNDAVRKALEPINARYISMLEELLGKFTKEGRLNEAKEVEGKLKIAREKQAALAPPPEPPDPDVELPAGSITLTGSTAVLEGSLHFEDGIVKNWLRSNARATWHTRDVPAGKYDVYFVYDSAADMGGIVKVEDFTYDFSVQITPTSKEVSLVEEKTTKPKPGTSNRPPALVPRTDRPLVFRRVRVGSIETRGGVGMKVSAKSVGEGGIMNLKEIQLIPAP